MSKRRKRNNNQPSNKSALTTSSPPPRPSKERIWLIFGVGITLFAIFVSIMFDLSLKKDFGDILNSRFPDFVLAILAISSSVINIIIDLTASIDINKKIDYAIFPALTMATSLSYYSFFYGRSDELSIKWCLVLPISIIILLINIRIGYTLLKE